MMMTHAHGSEVISIEAVLNGMNDGTRTASLYEMILQYQILMASFEEQRALTSQLEFELRSLLSLLQECFASHIERLDGKEILDLYAEVQRQ